MNEEHITATDLVPIDGFPAPHLYGLAFLLVAGTPPQPFGIVIIEVLETIADTLIEGADSVQFQLVV